MIIDLFAGAGGWDEGLRTINPEADCYGIEIDPYACTTAASNGHPRAQADTKDIDPTRLPITGLIASPPCTTFSMSGHGKGRQALDTLIAAIHPTLTTGKVTLRPGGPDIASAALTLEPARWIAQTNPHWVAMEQVPPVLPIWETYTANLRLIGYHAWCGILNAADYGVPQTRRRAILIASRVKPVAPPEPTHTERPETPLIGEPLKPWVSIADALGQPPYGETRTVTQPSPTITSSTGSWVYVNGTRANAARRTLDQPAPTIFFGASSNEVHWKTPAGDHRRVTTNEAARLQGFPSGYHWRGTKTSIYTQIGNAIPPPLAAAVLSTVTERNPS